MTNHPLSAKEVREQIWNGTLSPLQHLESQLAVIHKLNPKLNALRIVATTQAKDRANELSQNRSPKALHGLTFSAKDHIDIKGLGRSNGCKYGANDNVAQSCAAASLLEEAGAICIGKGNQAHHGRSYFTSNRDFGTTENPYRIGYSPGGSGGGDAAALASGMCDFALGADSGGSIRVPANFCGLFGLLPTQGLISDSGLSAHSHTFRRLTRSLGPLTRSLDDLELLFRILARFDRTDAASYSSPFRSQTPEEPKKKFIYFTEMNGTSCAKEIESSLMSAVSRFEQAGYTGTALTPKIFEQCFEVFIILFGQAGLISEDLVHSLQGLPPDLANESDDLKTLRSRIASELPALTVESLFHFWHMLDSLRDQSASLFNEIDFVLAPVCAILPPPQAPRKLAIDGVEEKSENIFQFAAVPNTLNLPALAFPTEISSTGLPLGLQLIGERYHEHKLFRALRDAGYTSCLSPRKA